VKDEVLVVAVTLLLGVPAHGQTCNSFDPDRHNNPVCGQATMYTIRADHGFVTATGHWEPKGVAPDESIVEVTCVRTPVAQFSSSKIGFCLVAMAYLPFSGSRNLGISTNYYDVMSWDESHIIAERNRPEPDCEQLQLVLNFPSNTVTLTSTFSFASEICAKWHKDQKQSEAFTLKHYPLELYPSKDLNPFLTGLK